MHTLLYRRNSAPPAILTSASHQPLSMWAGQPLVGQGLLCLTQQLLRSPPTRCCLWGNETARPPGTQSLLCPHCKLPSAVSWPRALSVTKGLVGNSQFPDPQPRSTKSNSSSGVGSRSLFKGLGENEALNISRASGDKGPVGDMTLPRICHAWGHGLTHQESLNPGCFWFVFVFVVFLSLFVCLFCSSSIVFIRSEKFAEPTKFLRCEKLCKIPGKVYIHNNNKISTQRISQQERESWNHSGTDKRSVFRNIYVLVYTVWNYIWALLLGAMTEKKA